MVHPLKDPVKIYLKLIRVRLQSGLTLNGSSAETAIYIPLTKLKRIGFVQVRKNIVSTEVGAKKETVKSSIKILKTYYGIFCSQESFTNLCS